MKTGLHGWCGQIIKVDLSSGRTSTMDTMPYADRFLGGRGIATRIYWEEVLPGTGAFDHLLVGIIHPNIVDQQVVTLGGNGMIAAFA